MTTKTRKNMTHSFNHVMVRGHNRQDIFLENSDYSEGLKNLEQVVKKYHCKIHLFCLMTNHIHLLIETTHIPLSRIMQTFLAAYAKKFNRSKLREGYLFQGRYKAISISAKSYFLELVYYIHNNPVKAKIVEEMSQYAWSSHNYYARRNNAPFLESNYLLMLIKKDFSSYHDFITYYANRSGDVTNCTFNPNGLLDIETSSTDKLGLKLRLLSFVAFKEICQVICEILEINFSDLASVSQARSICLARSLCTHYLHFYAKFSLTYIGIQFEHNPKSLSQTMYRHINAPANHNLLKRIDAQFIKYLDEKKLYQGAAGN